jgi:hypothetical protein
MSGVKACMIKSGKGHRNLRRIVLGSTALGGIVLGLLLSAIMANIDSVQPNQIRTAELIEAIRRQDNLLRRAHRGLVRTTPDNAIS